MAMNHTIFEKDRVFGFHVMLARCMIDYMQYVFCSLWLMVSMPDQAAPMTKKEIGVFEGK